MQGTFGNCPMGVARARGDRNVDLVVSRRVFGQVTGTISAPRVLESCSRSSSEVEGLAIEARGLSSTLFVAAVTDAFTAGLVVEGFARTPALDVTVDGVCVTSWCRDQGWKQDAVEVSRAQSGPDNVLVHLRIYLPCPPGERTTLAGTTVAGVLGGRGRIWFPNLLGWPLESRAPSFGARVLRDTRRALPWFDGYATPGICLTRLDAGETPWGLARGRSYQALAAYPAERRSAGA